MKVISFVLLFLSSVAFADYGNSTKYPDTTCTGVGITLHVDGVAQTPTYNQDHTAQNAAREISARTGKVVTMKKADMNCSTVWRNNPTYSASSAASSVSSPISSSSAVSSVPNGSWVRKANFEGVLGSVAVGSDAFSGSTKAIISDEVAPMAGSRVAKLPIPAGCGGCFGTWGGIINFPTALAKGDEVRIKLSVYWPVGFNYNANPWLKFLRVKTPSGYNDIYIPNSGNSHAYQFIYEGEQQWTRFGASSDKVKFGVWETYEFYLKFDNVSTTNGGTAMARFWKDGRLLGEMPERRTLGSADQTATAFYLFTYWNGENAPAQHVYVDDITITGTHN